MLARYERLQDDVEEAVVKAARRRTAAIEAAAAKRLAEADRQAAEHTRESLAAAAELMYGIRTEAERVGAELIEAARIEAERIALQCVSDAQRISDQLIANAEHRARLIIEQAVVAAQDAPSPPAAPAMRSAAGPGPGVQVSPRDGHRHLPPPPQDRPAGGGAPPSTLTDADAGAARRRRFPRVPMSIRIVLLIVVAVLAADLLRSFVVSSYTVASTSMEPRLHDGDRLVVDKLSYRVRDIERGDVVIVDTDDIPPQTRPDGDSVVKRVIGLPGERIQAIEGKVLVDDQLLDETWLGDDVTTPDFGSVLVPEGSIFVLGDNRGTSIDGRTFGAIPEGAIIGQVEWVIWPLGDAGRL